MVANTATDMTRSIYHERQVIIKYFMFSINNGTIILQYIHIHTYIHIYIQN